MYNALAFSSLVSDFLYDDLHNHDFQTINNLSKGLYNLHSIEGVADTRLINLEHDWMISNLGFTSTEDFPNQDLLSEYAKRPQNLFWLANDSISQENNIRLVICPFIRRPPLLKFMCASITIQIIGFGVMTGNSTDRTK
ncbi:hypothetical protein [Paenibacillus sp. Soil522]|uniref:hypothetical protein n=1 Tax=Paenibacillus sp. Soil522 TaxID=1736388 RepID=UPI000AEE8CC9|nr:hypothetical protein [Paenibacillus sp. Soil522]